MNTLEDNAPVVGDQEKVERGIDTHIHLLVGTFTNADEVTPEAVSKTFSIPLEEVNEKYNFDGIGRVATLMEAFARYVLKQEGLSDDVDVASHVGWNPPLGDSYFLDNTVFLSTSSGSGNGEYTWDTTELKKALLERLV